MKTIAGTVLRGVLRIAATVLLIRGIWELSAYPTDDAYIHLRVARNFAFTSQPFFNTGEPIMGGSSPLWMMALAAIFKISGYASIDPARALASISCIAVMVAAEGLVRNFTTRLWIAAIAGIACALFVSPISALMMETPLAVAFLLGAAWAMSRQRLKMAGALTALACATRFELFVAAGIALVALYGWKSRRRFALGFLPIAVAEALFLVMFYGSIIPNTMRAKAIVYHFDWRSFRTQLGIPGHGWWLIVLALVSLTACAWWWWTSRDNRACSLFTLVVSGVILLGIWSIRRAFIFPWYWPLVTVPVVTAAIGIALRCAKNGSGAPWCNRHFTSSVVLLALSIAVLLPVCRHWLPELWNGARGRFQETGSLNVNARAVSYLEIGASVSRTCSAATIMAAEIGALGWTFPGRIIDGVGLVSPEVLPYHPLHVPSQRPGGDVGAIPARAVADLRPDLVVAMEVFASDILQNRAQYPGLMEYEELGTIPVFHPRIPWKTPDKLWGSRSTLIYRRRGSCDSLEIPGMQ